MGTKPHMTRIIILRLIWRGFCKVVPWHLIGVSTWYQLALWACQYSARAHMNFTGCHDILLTTGWSQHMHTVPLLANALRQKASAAVLSVCIYNCVYIEREREMKGILCSKCCVGVGGSIIMYGVLNGALICNKCTLTWKWSTNNSNWIKSTILCLRKEIQWNTQIIHFHYSQAVTQKGI